MSAAFHKISSIEKYKVKWLYLIMAAFILLNTYLISRDTYWALAIPILVALTLLFDFSFQTQQVVKGYLGTTDFGGGRINTNEVQRIRKNMEEKGGDLIMLQELIRQEAANYALIKKDYDRAYMDHDRQFTYSNIISSPQLS